jgi:TolA-binding protein
VTDRLPFSGLPPAGRWAALGGLALLIVLVVATATWSFLQHRDAGTGRAFATASAAYREATGSSAEATQVAEAEKALKQFLSEYPRSAPAAQAWYLLGNLQYRRGDHDAAIAAFGEAARRDSGSLGALSRLGAGYAWEAKKQPAKALEVYQDALKGRGPKEYLYAEFLLGVARSQEQLTQREAAVETYRRLLKDVPDSPRAEEVRTRLAILGAAAA